MRLLLVIAILGLSITACSTQKQPDDLPPTIDGELTGPFEDISAAELVEKITVGWNLGNTLDTTNLFWLNNPSVSQMETAWGNPVTTQPNIMAIKKAGFNAVRIPISWAKCTDSEYNIRADWMARVKVVVDFVYDNNMVVILNSHHDEDIFKLRDNEMDETKKAFQRVWEQIAAVFKDYDEKLIFECLNEPRTIGSPAEWNGGTNEERNNLNILGQFFVDIIRASGGINARRILMVPTYAASATASAMNALVVPNDPTNEKNKIIVSIHAYEPYNFALNEQSPVDNWSVSNTGDTLPIIERVSRAYDLFVSKGIPVIMGEFAALNKKDNTAARAAWAEYYVNYAKSKGARCFWWDDGGGFKLLNRSSNTFYYPEIVDGLMKGIQ
jgi:endoglucanase